MTCPYGRLALNRFGGGAQTVQGDRAGLELSRQGWARIRSKTCGAEVMYGAMHLDALAALTCPGEVLELVYSLLETATQRQDGHFLPELHRLKGEALLAAKPELGSAAEACVQQALHLARQANARMLELRAAWGLFRLRVEPSAWIRLNAIAASFGEDCSIREVLEVRRLGRRCRPP
ncbi:MAG: hypothetical protein FIA97_03085 [Methylococcaceae bacterium]|nr:hypothetical protein [Methylococcaceae bacterium]